MIFLFLVIIQSIKVVILPYSNDNSLKYLNHKLKIIHSNLQNPRIIWDLERNELIRYRIRAGKYFLDLGQNNKLAQKDGGKDLESYDELQRLNELKKLIGENSEEPAEEKEPVKKESNDPIVQKKNSLLSSLVGLLSNQDYTSMRSELIESSFEKKESMNLSDSGSDKKPSGPEIKAKDNISEKKDNISSTSFMDPITQEYFKSFEEKNNNTQPVAETKPEAPKEPTKKEPKEKKPKKKDENLKSSKLTKEKKKDSKSKQGPPEERAPNENANPIKSEFRNDFNFLEGDNRKSLLTSIEDVSKSNLLFDEDNNGNTLVPIENVRKSISTDMGENSHSFLEEKNKSNQPNLTEKKSDQSPNVGFDFELIPIFTHKLDKKIVIMRKNLCLTHGLIFKPCKFVDAWEFPPDFYWEIFKIEDTGYIRKLQTIISKKTNSNQHLKENQFVDTKNCPNSCPGGNCDSGSGFESETGDSYSSDVQPTKNNPKVPKPSFQNAPSANNFYNQQKQGMIPPPRNNYNFQPYNQYYPTQPIRNVPVYRPNVAPVRPKEKILVDKDEYMRLLQQNKKM